jgi:hypothetical protein
LYDREPTVRARYLGHALEQALHARGWNATEVSKVLGWSPSKTSRVLSGKRCAGRVDVSAFLAICGVVGARRDELLDLVDKVYEPMWWQDFGSRLPVRLQPLADNENEAIAITCFHPTQVPTLLQVPEYAGAHLAAQPIIPDREIDDRVAHVATRQRIFDRSFQHMRFTAFLDEHVLTCAGIGSAAVTEEVMSEQVHHLLRMAVRPTMEIRLLPEDSGAALAGPFSLLEFTTHSPVVCLEQTTCIGFLEGKDTIKAYRRILTELARRALSEPDTRVRLAEIADARSTDAMPHTHPHAVRPTAIWASD